MWVTGSCLVVVHPFGYEMVCTSSSVEWYQLLQRLLCGYCLRRGLVCR